MHFSNAEVEEKTTGLGFSAKAWACLQIGDIDIRAVEHPEKGMAMFLSCC
jgi:hypothetical protein